MAARWTSVVSVAAGLVLASAVLAGCSGSSSSPTPGVSPTQELATVASTVDAASSVHLVLTSKDLPSAVSGVVGADGVGTHAPAFQGTLQLVLAGTTASSKVVAVDGKVYATLPFASGPSVVDPATFGAPDPAHLFTPGTGLTSLLTATKDPVAGSSTRKGSEVLSTYSGSIPGTAVADLFVVGDRTGTFTVTYGVVSNGSQLRTVELTGPFYAGSTSTYDLVLDQYGAAVEISKP
jgi:lipoprotein LprG